ncbi:hypothetical protein BASA81_009855 [Batrachochytrium salamandrivorans]|nr:hypothetical protein BASA81_009855 [Batrachochytrium salamandrivorans]
MHVIHPKDVSKFAGTLVAMCALAHWRRRTMRLRHLPKDYPEDKLSWVDHPAFGYLYENLTVLSVAYLVAKYVPQPDPARPLRTLGLLITQMLVMVDPFLSMEKLMASKVFSHVPYFSERAPPDDWRTIVTDYIKCNIPVITASSLILVVASKFASKEDFDKMFSSDAPPLRFFPYLAKLAFCRVFVDVVFGLAHRFMHENQWAYANIHKLHHTHNTPRTVTNFRFFWVDQFIEAPLPVYLAITALFALGCGPSKYEQPFIVLPLLYYESASHTGKEIPIVTWFPLLSPLIDYLTGCDQRLIEYHTRHHQLYKCNYSISPWFDKLCGTYRIDLPEHYNATKVAETSSTD